MRLLVVLENEAEGRETAAHASERANLKRAREGASQVCRRRRSSFANSSSVLTRTFRTHAALVSSSASSVRAAKAGEKCSWAGAQSNT